MTTNETKTEHTYTVRELGCTSWAGPGLSRAEAEEALRSARNAGLTRAILVEDDS